MVFSLESSARYAVEVARDPVYGVNAYLLRDHQVGSLARVLPALGNSLMGFAAGLPGRRLEAMLTPFLTMLTGSAKGRFGSRCRR